MAEMTGGGKGEAGAGLYRRLAERVRMGGSERMARIWSILCSEDEAELLLTLPSTAEDIAAKTGKTQDEIIQVLESLYHRGVVFRKPGEGAMFELPRGVIHMHSASVAWPEAPPEFFDLWKDFMDNEYPEFLRKLEGAGLGPFMRVIQVNHSIKTGATVLPLERAENVVEQSRRIAVIKCRCRMAQRKCDAPLEVCLQLNEGADYMLSRGIGREVKKDEALAILKQAEDAGLVHMKENREGVGTALCNCCPSCCMGLEPMIKLGLKGFSTPSRFLSVVDAEECNGCETCMDRCPAKAIAVENDVAVVDGDKCIGCGLCSSACPVDAISLEEIRPVNSLKG